MRIGVYLQEPAPETGGSYTFESQILESFLTVADQSKHHFTMLGEGGFSERSQIENEGLQIGGGSHAGGGVVARSQNKLKPFHFFLKSPLVKSLKGSVKSSMPWLEKVVSKTREKTHSQVAKRLRLDLTWSISPGSYTQEIPYITPVFDLQHRLQPFFPEISARGEWEKRESILCPLIRKSTMLIAGTQVGKSEIERFYSVPADRIRVIPFPTPLFNEQAKDSDSSWIFDKYDLPKRYLFYPAQFWPHKNHANLLLAIFRLKQQFDLTVPVVLVGSNKGNLEYLQKLVGQYGLSEQVRVLGFVPRADLAALYREAIALTFVSFFGPDNLPPLEAFSLGCPVIASEVAGASEQLGDTAKLVNPKSAEQIALAIKAFWEDEALRQSYIEKGYQRAGQWSAQNYVQEVFKIFDELEPILNCWQA